MATVGVKGLTLEFCDDNSVLELWRHQPASCCSRTQN